MSPSNKSQFGRTVIEHHLIGHPVIHDNTDKGSFRPIETLNKTVGKNGSILYAKALNSNKTRPASSFEKGTS